MVKRRTERAEKAGRGEPQAGLSLVGERDGRYFYTTSRGVELECLPIAVELEEQEQNIRAQVEWPQPPTYTFEAGGLGGDLVTMEHTAETIQDLKTTPEEKAAWVEYQALLAEARMEFRAKLVQGRRRLLALRGTRVVDAERLEKRWAREHEWMGMVVPGDAMQRKEHFFKTEVVGNDDLDVFHIIAGIYKASGYDREVITQLEARFRALLGQSEGPDAGAGQEAPQERAGGAPGEEAGARG